MKLFIFSLFLLVVLDAALACSSDADCGSGDDSAPGLCVSGVCQCGVGFGGNLAVDPTACSLVCAPGAVPDSVAFLREPNVTVGANAGSLELDIAMAPYLRQTPATVAFLHPSNGSACPLMSAELGLGRWTQEILNDASQCHSRYLYAAPFAGAVGTPCWESLAPSTESGSQFSITFNRYKTRVEVIQQGLAPFGQSASRQAERDATLTRAFRRDYTISVATQFKPNSAPFSLIAEPPVGPTAVNDTASTPQNVPISVAVLTNDLAGYQNVDGVQVPNPLNDASLSIIAQPAHGSLSIVEGSVVYTPASLYHGPDAFQYEICDTASLCDQAHVAVVVTPDPPVANDDAAQCAAAGSVDVEVLGNDVAGVGGLVTLTIVSAPNAAHGSASVVSEPESPSIIRFTAAAGFAGLTTLEYQICDGSNPTVLCDTALVTIDVDGVGPVAVNDARTLPQNAPATAIDVLDNDLQGTEALNASSVTIVGAAAHGSIISVDSATGSISYQPNAGYHGPDQFTYRVCDVAEPPKCAEANVTLTITPSGPNAVDDAASTPYLAPVTVPVLANDVAGAQPLQPDTVSIVGGPSNGEASVNPVDGSITYTPEAGFVGSESISYQVCDNSSPTPLCAQATLTIVVQPLGGGSIQYRLVTIDYDLANGAIVATVQTRTAAGARVANVTLNAADSVDLAPVLQGPTSTTACDPGSPAGSCDQFHVVRFSNDPCQRDNAELVLGAALRCPDGSDIATCGFQSVQSAFRMDQLFLTYDACPRVVEYGIDSAASFLRLHEDQPRQVAVSAPAQQGSTLFGRCSVTPSAGSIFQEVTLQEMHVLQQNGASGPVDLGDQLAAGFMVMQSSLVSSSPNEAVFDFDLVMEPSFFLLANTYYLEATVNLIFANTGPLTRKLRMPLKAFRKPNGKMSLRSTLSNVHAVELVAVSGRNANENEEQQGIFSNTFNLRAAEGELNEANPASADNTAMIAGIAGGIAGLVVVAAFIVVAVVVKRRRKNRERAGSDAPLTSVNLPSSNDLDL